MSATAGHSCCEMVKGKPCIKTALHDGPHQTSWGYENPPRPNFCERQFCELPGGHTGPHGVDPDRYADACGRVIESGQPNVVCVREFMHDGNCCPVAAPTPQSTQVVLREGTLSPANERAVAPLAIAIVVAGAGLVIYGFSVIPMDRIVLGMLIAYVAQFAVACVRSILKRATAR